MPITAAGSLVVLVVLVVGLVRVAQRPQPVGQVRELEDVAALAVDMPGDERQQLGDVLVSGGVAAGAQTERRLTSISTAPRQVSGVFRSHPEEEHNIPSLLEMPGRAAGRRPGLRCPG